MAQRRMFSRTITESDAFTEMPLSAQALYFHLGLNADDDGFVNSPKHVQRGIGAAEDDLAILVAKRFLIPFDSGVVVIRHWKTNNYIRHDRYNTRKPVVITSNFSKRELIARLSIAADSSTAEAIVSRLFEMTTKIEMGGEDRRLSNPCKQ